MQTIFALMIVATAGGQPQYDRTYGTQRGCERGAARMIAERGATDAYCVAVQFSTSREE